MASERRVISFSKKEVGEALKAFAEQQKRATPDGPVVDVVYRNGADIAVELAFEGSSNRRVSFHELETAAALIAYCGKRRIPVPRSGEKAVRIRNGDLALKIEIGQR